MSYVEHCNKHGQYHADHICGECFEELKKENSALKAELDLANTKIGRMYGVEMRQERDTLRAALERFQLAPEYWEIVKNCGTTNLQWPIDAFKAARAALNKEVGS